MDPCALTISGLAARIRNGLRVRPGDAVRRRGRRWRWSAADDSAFGSCGGRGGRFGNVYARNWTKSFGLLAGDFDGNGVVNDLDLRNIRKRFTRPGVARNIVADVDGNGVVNQQDLDQATAMKGDG